MGIEGIRMTLRIVGIILIFGGCHAKKQNDDRLNTRDKQYHIDSIYNRCRNSTKVLVYSDCCNSYENNGKYEYATKCSYIINATQKGVIQHFEFKDSITTRSDIQVLADSLFLMTKVSDTINQTDSRLVILFENNNNYDTLSIFDQDMVLNDKYLIVGSHPFSILIELFPRLQYMCPPFIEFIIEENDR